MEAHIADQDLSNRKNGKGRKKLRTTLGEIKIETPRDRLGTFQPKVIPK